jgi:hypothetical protein
LQIFDAERSVRSDPGRHFISDSDDHRQQFAFESTIRPASDITPQISNISFQCASAEVDVVIPLTGDEGQRLHHLYWGTLAFYI